MRPAVQKGDLFVVRGKGLLFATILFVEWFHSKDGQARYGHAGIITDSDGSTFEALWTVRASNLSQCEGQKVFIVRPEMNWMGDEIPHPLIDSSLEIIKRTYQGKIYPFWRLPLHLAPALAKFLSWRRTNLVCSELVARYEQLIGTRPGPCTGINPDDLEDRWRLMTWCGDFYQIVYDDIW